MTAINKSKLMLIYFFIIIESINNKEILKIFANVYKNILQQLTQVPEFV